MFRSPAVRRAAAVLAISLVAPLSALALPASGAGRITPPSVSIWEWLATSWSALAPRLDLPGISKAEVKPLPDPAPQNRSEVGCTVDPNGTPCQGGRP